MIKVSKENILISVISASFVYAFYFTIGMVMNNFLGGVDLLFKHGLAGFAMLFFVTALSAMFLYPLTVILYSITNLFSSFLYLRIIHINNVYIPLSFLLIQSAFSLSLVFLYVNISDSLYEIISNQELYILIFFSLLGSYRAVRLYYKILFNPEIKYLNNY